MPTSKEPIQKRDAYLVMQKCGHTALTLNRNNANKLAKHPCDTCAESEGLTRANVPDGCHWQVTG